MNGKKFTLKSGNKTSFKGMGSTTVSRKIAQFTGDIGKGIKKFGKALEVSIKSPAKQTVIEGKTYPKGYTKKDVEFLKEQREDVVRYEDLDAKGKAIWKKQGKPIPKKKKSPLKQDRPVEVFEKKGDRIKEPKNLKLEKPTNNVKKNY
jgi:hypothetical protein